MNTAPNEPRRPARSPWVWVGVGLVILFVVGLASGMAVLLISRGTEPESAAPAATPAPPATAPPEPTASPTEAPTAEPTQAAEEPEAAPASSVGMVQVPGGSYIVGSRLTTIDGYWIDQFEVSNAEYSAYLIARQLGPPEYWASEGIPAQRGGHPVRGLTWEQARSYCAWAGKRLPTETEWEVAARGRRGSLYPWGDDPAALKLPASGTYAVGSFPANRSYFGAYDMAGNVWEWVGDPYLPTAEGERVLRGGAYNFSNDMLERLPGDPAASTMTADAGVRCAADEVVIEPDTLLILSDEFADVHSGWSQARAPVDAYFYGYHPSDFYHVQVGASDDCLAVRHDLALDDFVAEVDIFKAKTNTETGDYRNGVMVREQGGDYYALLVSPRAQSWRVVRGNPAGMAVLAEGSDKFISGLARETSDKLTVVANGPTISFFVNGRLVSTVFDEQSRSGNLGFMVQTLDETYAHMHFDRVVVSHLPINATLVSAASATTPASTRVSDPPCSGTVTGDDLLEQYTTYTVQEGDTLSLVAAKFGLSVAEVQGANGRQVTDPNVINVGQVLIIPIS